MSTSTMPKPKRPLSGYNLYYRYKRIKILEATARTDANDDGHRNKAIIHDVITALPGLEDVPPDSPILNLPPAKQNAVRAATIRSAMEGKLFPNENTRTRVHCKVHGMGFVEMGRTMRQMWGQADKFTKEVFCELADVGRVRYKSLMAEYKYKMSLERHEDATSVTPDYGVHRSAETSALQSTRMVRESKGVAPAGSLLSTLAAAAAIDSMTTEATSTTSSFYQQARSTSDPRRRVSFDLNFHSPDLSEARSYGGRGHLFESLALKAMLNPAGNAASLRDVRSRYQRLVSSTAAELDFCNDSLFERRHVERVTAPLAIDALRSLPVEARDCSVRRRVSTDVPPALNGILGAGRASYHSADANLDGLKTDLELRQIELRNAMKNLKDKIMQNDSMLPPDMRVFRRSWEGR